MAKFDIGSAASRYTGLDNRMRNEAIRQEVQPKQEVIKQQFEPPQRDTNMTTQQPSGLPTPTKTIEWEGRFDKQGNLAVYQLPAGDGGGKYEIAGINDGYHPEAFKAISQLEPSQRAEAAAEYIKGYTAPLVSKVPGTIQPFVQDLAFNRGMGGATKYLQQGLNTLGANIRVDGSMGPKTLEAISNVQPQALMRAASDAQLQDEVRRAEANPERRKFLPGLEARIRNRLVSFGS